MKTPHKHAEVIKAWADGEAIEMAPHTDAVTWFDALNPGWHKDVSYRIKKAPKPDVVKYTTMDLHQENCFVYTARYNPNNLKLTFDGETGKLKSAEVL